MAEREISLDTETTGLSPSEGHRLVEIGAVELIDRMPTGRAYHQYINPERDMPEGAFRVHGLSEEFLSGYPVFKDVAQEFLDFVGNAKLVIHNAEFDMRFINAELAEIKRNAIPTEQVFCTLIQARKQFPGSPASLDALCKRFEIDNSHRTKHGALLDAELLADMYLHLMGGPQQGLGLETISASPTAAEAATTPAAREPIAARPHTASNDELAAHAQFLAEHIPGAKWGT